MPRCLLLILFDLSPDRPAEPRRPLQERQDGHDIRLSTTSPASPAASTSPPCPERKSISYARFRTEIRSGETPAAQLPPS